MSLEKIKKIRSDKNLLDEEIEAVFLTKPQNIIYVLGFRIESDTFIMVPREEVNDGKIWVFLNALEYDQVKHKIDQNKEFSNIVQLKQIPAGKLDFIPKEINQLKIKRVGFEEDFISVKKYNEWKEKFNIKEFVPASEIINKSRLTKTNVEIDRMRKAAELGDIGFKTVYETIRKGIKEEELAAEAEYEMRKKGSKGTSFDTIIASGYLSTFPHATISNKKIEDGDIIVVDIGARCEDYCSYMTRSFIFGKIDSNKARLINLVNEGQRYALDNIRAGVSCKDIDKITRDFFFNKNKEWGKRFLHSLGHGVGIDIHENPYLSPMSQEVLEENMVVTVEPGLYIENLGGARTEDLVVIKKEGFIPLTLAQKYNY